MTTVDGPRIGLVGAGAISEAHLPHLLRLGRQVSVFAEEGAERLVARCGGSVVGSYRELLERSDVVDVVTPTPTHAALVLTALRAGKDVISEKPLTRHTAEAEHLRQVAAEEGRQLHVAHVVRYFPEYSALHTAVSDGLLGTVAVGRYTRSGAYPTRTAWFADRDASGGIVLDQMIHDLDIARWVAGEVVRVSAVLAGGGSPSEPVQAAHVLLTHAGGAISQVSGVWGPQHTRFTTSYDVTGTLATVHHDSASEQDVRLDLAASRGGGQALPDVDPEQDPYFLELADFVRAIGGGPPPRVGVDDAVEAVRIAVAALDSLDSGQPVELMASTRKVS